MYNDAYNLTTDSVANEAYSDFFNNLSTAGAGIIVFTIIMFLFALAIAVFLIIAECKMFKKAGESWS